MPEYMDGHLSVQRFYSRTNSFLMIEPEPKQLRCDQQKIVTVHYSLNRDAYRDEPINFFYLVSLSGWIPGSCLIVCLAQNPYIHPWQPEWTSLLTLLVNTTGSIKNELRNK